VNGYGSFGSRLVAVLLALSPSAISQSSSAPPSKTPNSSPHCSAEKELVPGSLRAQRDLFWNAAIDWLIGPTGDIEEPTGNDIDLTADPFDVPGAVILTATVGGYRTVSSALKPYVEATLCVGRVFGNWSGAAHPSSEQHITILAKGDWASDFRTPPDPYRLELTLQPERTYLLILTYHGFGDFYELGDSWDISDGTVRANSPVTKYQAERGVSPLEGLTVQQVGPALKRIVLPPN
jgi:hypothetical protein